MTQTLDEYASANARSLLEKAVAAFERADHYRGINDRTGERQCQEFGEKCRREAMSWLRR